MLFIDQKTHKVLRSPAKRLVALTWPKQFSVFAKVTPLWNQCPRWVFLKFYFLCCHSCFLWNILIGHQKDEMGFFSVCLFVVFLNESIIHLIATNTDEFIRLSKYVSANKNEQILNKKLFLILNQQPDVHIRKIQTNNKTVKESRGLETKKPLFWEEFSPCVAWGLELRLGKPHAQRRSRLDWPALDLDLGLDNRTCRGPCQLQLGLWNATRWQSTATMIMLH